MRRGAPRTFPVLDHSKMPQSKGNGKNQNLETVAVQAPSCDFFVSRWNRTGPLPLKEGLVFYFALETTAVSALMVDFYRLTFLLVFTNLRAKTVHLEAMKIRILMHFEAKMPCWRVIQDRVSKKPQ